MRGDTSIVHPPVLWAQRNDVVFLTVDMQDMKRPDIKLEETRLSLKGKGGQEGKEYVVDIEFFKEINIQNSRYAVRPRNIEFTISKKEPGPYWDRLLKVKQKVHWLKTDFQKWKDEDDSDDDGGDRNLEDMMAQMGGGFDGDGLPDMDDIAPDDEDKPDSDDEELPDLE
ncbi:prostaglandin E synthase 3-like isoform X2 [Ptychodera flava]|uniref:prostaglandin E synthase 3-like isoform X2 n=1 Tax=Ptychodera flava TaxID=63121 RepID=UPI00396A2818